MAKSVQKTSGILITKQPCRLSKAPNLADYEREYARFDWQGSECRPAPLHRAARVPTPARGEHNPTGQLGLELLSLGAPPRVARIDEAALAKAAQIATRFLHDVIDVSRFPLRRQSEAARRTRRIGLGVTGLADALIMLGLDYGSEKARAVAASVMRTICHAAYRTSIDLAAEKGAFPAFRRADYLAAPFIAALPTSIRDGIARNGIRNSHLLAIAPTGSISLLANNISSGIERVFAAAYQRKVLDANGAVQPFSI